jgi:hypothetical protein
MLLREDVPGSHGVARTSQHRAGRERGTPDASVHAAGECEEFHGESNYVIRSRMGTALTGLRRSRSLSCG